MNQPGALIGFGHVGHGVCARSATRSGTRLFFMLPDAPPACLRQRRLGAVNRPAG